MCPDSLVGLSYGQHVVAGDGLAHVDRVESSCLGVESPYGLSEHDDIAVRFPEEVDVSSGESDLV